MKGIKNSGGFTLIELVVVIVILGILAVTAAPKFINLQENARSSVIEGVSGAIRASANLVYSKSIIEGEENLASTENPDAEGVATHYGYPAVTDDNTGIYSAVNGLDDGFETVTANGTFYVTLFSLISNETTVSATTIENTACYVSYSQPTASGETYTVNVDVSNCG